MKGKRVYKMKLNEKKAAEFRKQFAKYADLYKIEVQMTPEGVIGWARSEGKAIEEMRKNFQWYREVEEELTKNICACVARYGLDFYNMEENKRNGEAFNSTAVTISTDIDSYIGLYCFTLQLTPEKDFHYVIECAEMMDTIREEWPQYRVIEKLFMDDIEDVLIEYATVMDKYEREGDTHEAH